MLTSDFTGTYDYEKEEAEESARILLEDLADGYHTPEDFPNVIEKERKHWKKCLPETFDDWDRHFMAAINAGINK